MKRYIKPETEITMVQTRTAMLQASEVLNKNNSVSTSSQMTKERDVWSDGSWD